MPTVVEALHVPVQTNPPRKRWTREECSLLEPAGLWEQQHLELIWGDLISKMGKNRPHTNVLILIQAWLVGVFGVQFVNPETPIDVASEDNPTNEPEPDLIVLVKPSREYRAGNPRPQDLRLVVEISDSTLLFDLTTKAELYARAGIVEYWIFDINARRIIVHRDPREGRYVSVTAYTEQECVSPLAAPDRNFRTAEAFPEPQ
jgi:Uma2 family endonuclease